MVQNHIMYLCLWNIFLFFTIFRRYCCHKDFPFFFFLFENPADDQIGKKGDDDGNGAAHRHVNRECGAVHETAERILYSDHSFDRFDGAFAVYLHAQSERDEQIPDGRRFGRDFAEDDADHHAHHLRDLCAVAPIFTVNFELAVLLASAISFSPNGAFASFAAARAASTSASINARASAFFPYNRSKYDHLACDPDRCLPGLPYLFRLRQSEHVYRAFRA